ncbi:MAG: hypothetical protein WKF71_06200 [Pyrinomonadaceae bacterium]
MNQLTRRLLRSGKFYAETPERQKMRRWMFFHKPKKQPAKLPASALGQVQEKATSQIDKQKSNLAQGLGSVAESIRQMGDGLKDSGEQTGVGKVYGAIRQFAG